MWDENICKAFDWLLPQEILKQVKQDHSKRQALLQARAVVTVTVSAFFALVTQLFLGTYSALGFHDQLSSEIIREITVPLFTWQVSISGTLIYAAILYAIRHEELSIIHAAELGIYSFVIISAYVAIFGRFHTLSHVIFFAIPPFGLMYICFQKYWKADIAYSLCCLLCCFLPLNRSRKQPTLVLVNLLGSLRSVYLVFDVAHKQEFALNQENMQRSLDVAISAETAKSTFISNVSHGILATVDTLGKTRLNESQHALLNAIESCGTNLISVVDQVVTFTKIKHGKLEPENNVFDVFTLLQEIGDGLAPILERKKLDFVVFTDVNPLHRFMIGDVGCLRQIILNLLGNAIKFTDRGRIKLNIMELNSDEEQKESAKQQSKKDVKKSKVKVVANGSDSSVDGEEEKENIEEGELALKKVKVRIEVIDTGRGIAPDFLAQMYQPFAQEDSSSPRKFEGTGLGLSIVKGLLDIMHSFLEVKSDTQKGSNFSFCLTLPIISTFKDMCAASLPFSHEHLKLSAHKQEALTAQLRSLSFVILNRSNFLWSQRIARYFTEWGFTYRLAEKANLKNERAKEGCDIIILNDSVADLHWFMNEFKPQQQPAITTSATVAARTKPVTKQASTTAANSMAIVTPSTSLGEKQVWLTSTKTAIPPIQCVVLFSTIAGRHKSEKILKKFELRSVVIVSKPGGPVKILTAIIKAMESIRSQKRVTTIRSSSPSSSLSSEETASDNDNVIPLSTTAESQPTSEILAESELLFSPSIFGSVAMSTSDPSSQEIHALQLIKDETPMRQQTETKKIEKHQIQEQQQQMISSIKKERKSSKELSKEETEKKQV
ncbi:11911_t:CDS:10 [Ambispora gerdemannii]|uniref:11911_t:CDS:1 n=1 Tax=Ambispora gerdemannii TaxID=144530 RepID=A0A9N9GII0_9GLOM|nr:11911_t:CDS:10 [Ambispora gerdemannii]